MTKVLENGEIYTYSYRADGLRHEKNINGEITTFIWDEQNTVGEINGNKELISKYIRGINLIYMDDLSDQKKFYLFNGYGDVVHLTDEEGEVVRKYNYDAFGNQEKILFGDLNGDGLINSTDIVLLRRYLLEIIKDFPSENGKVAADMGYIGRAFHRIEQYDRAPDGTYKIFVVWNSKGDYHFYRQNVDGSWSSKWGKAMVVWEGYNPENQKYKGFKIDVYSQEGNVDVNPWEDEKECVVTIY
ncbi:UNVERIFIED_CONTAM: dockerin type I repeat protein [Acetivibrio alkalicellulosi]